MSFSLAVRKLSPLLNGFFRGRRIYAALNVSPRVSSTSSNFQSVFLANQMLLSTSAQPMRSAKKVTVQFVTPTGLKVSASGNAGDTLLDVVVNQKLDFEGFGACEGTLACSTCHLILDQQVYDQLGNLADEEMDMLDLAFGLTDTSRLGCQVCLTEELEGVTLRVPEGVNDIRGAGDKNSTKSP